MIVKSKVKYIQSLSHKKLRDEEGVFVAEGPKIINELLNSSNIEPVELFALPAWIAEYSASISATTTEVDEVMLARLSSLSTPNQVLGLFRKPALPAIHLADAVTLMADSIQDPGNLGTIIRCADWFGIRQLICSMDCADAYGPKTVQATMGSIARVAVYYEDLAEIITAHPSTHVYAATLGGKNIHEMKPLHHGALLVGNESKGISPALLELVYQQVTIPRIGQAESLNAAVATAIILSHLVRSPSPSHSHS